MGLKLDRRQKKVCVCILFLYYCILWSKNIIWLYFLSERRHYNFFHPLRDFQMSWTGLFKNIEIHIYVNLNAQWRRHKFVKKTPNFIWHYLVRSKIGKLVFVAFFEYELHLKNATDCECLIRSERREIDTCTDSSKSGRHGILIFSCLLFVLFEKTKPDILHQISKSRNPDWILFDSYHVLWSVWGFLSLYYLHVKINMSYFTIQIIISNHNAKNVNIDEYLPWFYLKPNHFKKWSSWSSFTHLRFKTWN